jgi:hypothetical protein
VSITELHLDRHGHNDDGPEPAVLTEGQRAWFWSHTAT